jgi:hypothetical protein
MSNLKILFKPIVLIPVLTILTLVFFYLRYEKGISWTMNLYFIILIAIFVLKHFISDTKKKN